MRHLEMANDAGEDQTKLEAVVASLEKNPVIGFTNTEEMAKGGIASPLAV